MNDVQSRIADAPLQDGSDVLAWMQRRAVAHGFDLDAAQVRAVSEFQRLYGDLVALERMEASFIRLLARRRTVKGVYLWGSVGRGKSFLMDSFYACAPSPHKRRIHFHRFMQEIHHGLNRHQGKENPVAIVARGIAKRTRLFCLDEFHVTDITDAMLMRRLLEGLFEQGVILLTTSNQHPDDLYPNGLQRSQFLPAIDLLKVNLEVINVDGGTDYRLRELEKAGVYHVGADAEVHLARAFDAITGHEKGESGGLEIESRLIQAKRHAGGVVWFDFAELCDGPRGKADYIELARRYHTVVVSGIPGFRPENADVMRRFTWMVDEFYDRRVKLIISASVPVQQLCPRAAHGDQFERTASRLIEMQTHDYLGQPHLP